MEWWGWVAFYLSIYAACFVFIGFVACVTYSVLQFWYERKGVLASFFILVVRYSKLIFKCCRAAVRNLKLFLFFIFNCCLPGTDVGTDFSTFLALVYLHPWWAGLTLAWMFVPFFIKLGIFLYDSLRKNNGTWDKFKDVMLHFPFIRPLYNLSLLIALDDIGYGSTNFNTKYSANVESIQKEVGLASLYECFFEAGPQENYIVKTNEGLILF
jgi:hypothetical protein